MTSSAAATKTSSSAPTELEALVALVDRFAASSLETTRLAVELQAKLPVILAAEVAAATSAAATVAAETDAKPLALYSCAGLRRHLRSSKPPSLKDLARPGTSSSADASRVCIAQRTDEADAVCNGVPNQLKQKKTSRREAIAWYRSHYLAAPPNNVQKWNEV
ncbi:hypothetical protein B0H13DRAFT_2327010 [Mycena leptocephala]|nr:hypothetical protein B0H13DRAFT_2327010 [Mycena leptocephala]